MPEHGFSLTRIFPYADKIEDSLLMREYTSQRKPVFWHILRGVGVNIDRDIKFDTHVSKLCSKTAAKLYPIRQLNHDLGKSEKAALINSFICGNFNIFF